MSKTLKVRHIGEDFWGRDCYENIETKRIYKMVDGCLHTSTPDWGEPDCPLRNKIEVVE